MGYRLNRLDEPVFMAVPKPMLTEFGIHYRLESCASYLFQPLISFFSADYLNRYHDGEFGMQRNQIS